MKLLQTCESVDNWWQLTHVVVAQVQMEQRLWIDQRPGVGPVSIAVDEVQDLVVTEIEFEQVLELEQLDGRKHQVVLVEVQFFESLEMDDLWIDLGYPILGQIQEPQSVRDMDTEGVRHSDYSIVSHNQGFDQRVLGVEEL